MAIAEMSVMTLVGLYPEKSAILDAMQKTGAVQIRSSGEYAFTERYEGGGGEEISARAERAEKVIAVITSAVEQLPKEARGEVIKDGFCVSKQEFFAMSSRCAEMEEYLDRVEKQSDRRAEITSERGKIAQSAKAYEPYLCLEKNFSDYTDTKYTAVYLGTVGADKTAKFISAAEEKGVYAEVLGFSGNENTVILIAHKSDRKTAEEITSQAGFRKCPFSESVTAREKLAGLDEEEQKLKKEDEELLLDIAGQSKIVRELKLYADYLSFCREKAEAEKSFGRTRAAFVMEAYVPSEMTENVRAAAEEASSAVFTQFEPVPRDEFAPTLNKNGKIVSNFETVTNMYSSPAYGALDPNAVMSFFFSLFMGLIMADVAYGILMIAGGFLLASRMRDGKALKRMAKVFAYGGIFAILFGALFDSWLGFPLLRHTLGQGYNDFYAAHLDQITANASISGINVPAILMWCLALGTVQIAVGLILKAVQSFGRGRYLEGIFGGIVWAIAMISLVVWVYAMATGAAALRTYGLYFTAGFAGLGILTAGITEKGFGKVTKIFTSAYGIINYVSDILSYARLYGLMLSGAQIASIFTNTLAIGMLFPLGIGGIIGGVILIIVGNLFNLAIGLLGAYIHDARLQYVEFFGKFYEGEGELFTPFGQTREHVYFNA